MSPNPADVGKFKKTVVWFGVGFACAVICFQAVPENSIHFSSGAT